MGRSIRFLAFSVWLMASSSARADLDERCKYDQLHQRSQGIGRNNWAKKCGYIKSQDMLNAINEEGTYLVFSNGRLGGGQGNLNVPDNTDAPCVSGLIKQGFCYTGCYTPEQRLSFSAGEFAIAEAYAEHQQLVTVLAPESRAEQFQFSEQPIKSYVRGETDELILILRTDAGQQLKVTMDHPLVDASGNIIKARDVGVGTVLLSASGEHVAVVERQADRYTGMVWNIRPASTTKLDNILIAEGLLTGSHRFQSQWSDELTRLYFRSEADISGL